MRIKAAMAWFAVIVYGTWGIGGVVVDPRLMLGISLRQNNHVCQFEQLFWHFHGFVLF